MKLGEGTLTVTLDGVTLSQYRVLSMEVTMDRVERALILAERPAPGPSLQVTIPSRESTPVQTPKPQQRPREHAQWKREQRRYRP